VASADVVVTGTTATQPHFDGRLVRPGAHVNGVGSHAPAAREVDSELVARARVVVDSFEAALAEAGDLLLPIEEGRIDRSHVGAELGEIVLGRKPGRERSEEITFFKSCGAALEDAVTAGLAVRRAREGGVGLDFDFEAR
jgi:ornithine cyclodeaminase/alanine dehydrogenase-like protein (mu-crystallin family)